MVMPPYLGKFSMLTMTKMFHLLCHFSKEIHSIKVVPKSHQSRTKDARNTHPGRDWAVT
jgi:hypothetical protein